MVEGLLKKRIKEINEVLRKPMIASSSGLVAMRMEELIDLQNLFKQLEENVGEMRKDLGKVIDDGARDHYSMDDDLWKAVKEKFVKWL